MTVDELVAELDQFTTELSNVTVVTLQELATQLQGQIVSGLDANKNLSRKGSKGLRGSIRVTSDNYRLGISMNYYGYYQIFGVSGSSVSALNLPTSVLRTFENSIYGGPSGGSYFSFQNGQRGIQPSTGAAYPIINLADVIAETITEQI